MIEHFFTAPFLCIFSKTYDFMGQEEMGRGTMK